MAPPWEVPIIKRRRGIPGGLTGNALVTAVISALVSGVISFYVAHYQSQDAAAQARNAQNIAGIVQVESAATNFDQVVISLYTARENCLNQLKAHAADCPPSNQGLLTAEPILDAALVNISDRTTLSLVSKFVTVALGALAQVGSPLGANLYTELGNAYYNVIARCGQLIQGQA